MATSCSIKTITEVVNSKMTILSFADMNDDGTTVPELFKADLLVVPKIVNQTSGVEGEGILSYSGQTVGELVDGYLTLYVDNDDSRRYFVDENGDLIYNFGRNNLKLRTHLLRGTQMSNYNIDYVLNG